MKVIVSLIVALAIVDVAQANPISFKGGYGVMPSYNKDWHDIQVNYTPERYYSIGLSSFYREGKGSTAEFGIAQVNYLLKRWNESDAQGNVVLSLGGGGRHDSKENESLAGYAALEADYETRRIYTLMSAETLQSDCAVHFSRYRGRLGVAPYKAPFDALQTWLVFQLDYMPEMNEDIRVTPLARFFYGNYFLEVGASIGEGTPFVAAAAHF